MDDSDNRETFIWHDRKDRTENTNRLAAAVAAKAITELFNVHGSLHRLQDGHFVAVDKAGMHEIVTKHIKTFGTINRGTADNPKWTIEYFSLQFPPAGSENALSGPDETILANLIDALVALVARAAGAQTDLKTQQLQEIRMRLKQGEPMARIARGYGVDADTIRAISLDR